MVFFLIHEPKYCICIVVCVYLIDRFLWCTGVSFLNLILMHQNPGNRLNWLYPKWCWADCIYDFGLLYYLLC